MAVSGDQWVREYNEAVKLAEDITKMISEKSSLRATGPDAQRYSSALRREITILGTRLDSLQSRLSELPGQQPLTDEEMNRRKERVTNLQSEMLQMASTVNMSNYSNRDSLLVEIKPADAMSRAKGLDNSGIVSLQRQIMKEQDEELEKLKEAIINTKHVGLAINEELDLERRLIVDHDERVEVTDYRPEIAQRRLAILNKHTVGCCSCSCLLLSVIGIVVLVAVIYMLLKHL